MLNKKIITWDRDEIIIKGLELTIENRYHHSPKKAKISCPHIKDGHRLESSGLALASKCSIYRNAKKHYEFGKHVLDHLNFSNHFSDEYHEKAVCKYGTACFEFIRLEKGGYLNFLKNSTNLKKLTADLCHTKIFRHPPRSYRHLRINQNIHKFIWSNYKNKPLSEPVDKEKRGPFNLLLDEVIENGYQYDLCLICNKDNKCNHNVYNERGINNLRSIITDKFNHSRYKKMGQPLYGKPQPANALMLSLLLYTRGDSIYDLCNAQRDGNYLKWKVFDYYLWHAIHYLSEKEYRSYTLYAGLHKTKQKERNITSGCFPTYVTTTLYKEIAESSLEKQGGMVIQITPNMHNAFICCDVSWISRFPDEHEIVIARTSSKMMKLAHIKPLSDKGSIQTLLLSKESSYDTIYKDTIRKISDIIGGNSLKNSETTLLDVELFKQLIAGKKDVPSDIQQIWYTFRHQQQHITIDMSDMYEYYKGFISLLIDPNCKNLLLFSEIANIFPNIIQITCKDIDYDGDKINECGDKGDYSSDIVNSNFILYLQRQLNNMSSNTKLKKIIIQTKSSAIKDNCKLYPTQFAALRWKIEKTERYQISLTDASVSIIWKDIIDKGVAPKILSIIQAKPSDKSTLTAASVSSIFKKLIEETKDIRRRAISVWKQHRYKQKSITIDMKTISSYHEISRHLLCTSSAKFKNIKIKNLLLFDKIAKIFPNVTQIICKDTDWDRRKTDEEGNQGDYSSAIVGSHFICGIKDQLSKMDKEIEKLKKKKEIEKREKKMDQVPKLQKIIIQTKAYQIGNDCNLYAKQFDLLGWQIAKEHNQITLVRLNGSVPGAHALSDEDDQKSNEYQAAEGENDVFDID